MGGILNLVSNLLIMELDDMLDLCTVKNVETPCSLILKAFFLARFRCGGTVWGATAIRQRYGTTVKGLWYDCRTIITRRPYDCHTTAIRLSFDFRSSRVPLSHDCRTTFYDYRSTAFHCCTIIAQLRYFCRTIITRWRHTIIARLRYDCDYRSTAVQYHSSTVRLSRDTKPYDYYTTALRL